jgi:hypothetical protein
MVLVPENIVDDVIPPACQEYRNEDVFVPVKRIRRVEKD